MQFKIFCQYADLYGIGEHTKFVMNEASLPPLLRYQHSSAHPHR